MKCPKCGSTDIDSDETAGQLVCMGCGEVVEENTIVNQVEFVESGDRSMILGQFVSATSSRPFNSSSRSRNRYGNSRESRDATLAMARRNIAQVASSLRLPNIYIDKAYRLYQLALQRNFIFGRRQMHVVATCLYTICRQEKSPHLLIDFSDALQVNVYVLGKSFLQFTRLLNLSLTIVDPALYIHRFATRMGLEDKLSTVCTTALRIVTRLKKDWVDSGRRPDGICAAAMLIAARSQGFNKTQQEVAKIFRVAPDTLRRRLDDFKATPSAQLTLDEFHQNDSTLEFDPPVYIARLVAEHGAEGVELDLNNGKYGARGGDEGGMDEEKGDDESRDLRIGSATVSVNALMGANGKPKQSMVKSLRVQEKQSFYESIYKDVSTAIQSTGLGTEESDKIVDALAAEALDVTREAQQARGPGAKPVSRLKRDREWGVELSQAGMKETEEQAMALAAKAAEKAKEEAEKARKETEKDAAAAAGTGTEGGDEGKGDEETAPATEAVEGGAAALSAPVDTAAPSLDPNQVNVNAHLNIAAVYKDMPDNGFRVPEAEVKSYMLNEREATKRTKIRDAMYGQFMADRDKRKEEKKKREKEIANRNSSSSNSKRKSSRRNAGGDADRAEGTKKSSKINYQIAEEVFKGDGAYQQPDATTTGASSSSSSSSKPAGDDASEDEDEDDDDDMSEASEDVDAYD